MRAPLERETPLLKYLLDKAGLSQDVSKLQVSPMRDGGMGSLQFASKTADPQFGKEVAACQFHDDDGVLVSATLNLDQQGQLFELDVWKVDFSPLRRWPTAADMHSHGKD
jgi:hypothetical protein